MIKYVLFDLDGTILDFKEGEKDAFINTMLELYKYNPNIKDIKLFSKINEECFLEYQNNKVSRKVFHHKRFEKILKELNIDGDIDLTNDLYVNKLKYSSVVYKDVIETLNYLYDKYDLFIASNGMRIVQLKRLELAGLLKYFKDYFISEDCSHNKPDKEFFNYVFDKINDNDKSKYIIIGDRLDTDIYGGNLSGIKTIYINRSNIEDTKNISDYTIYDLRDIKNIL